jgi:hypothetical protein
MKCVVPHPQAPPSLVSAIKAGNPNINSIREVGDTEATLAGVHSGENASVCHTDRTSPRTEEQE